MGTIPTLPSDLTKYGNITLQHEGLLYSELMLEGKEKEVWLFHKKQIIDDGLVNRARLSAVSNSEIVFEENTSQSSEAIQWVFHGSIGWLYVWNSIISVVLIVHWCKGCKGSSSYLAVPLTVLPAEVEQPRLESCLSLNVYII